MAKKIKQNTVKKDSPNGLETLIYSPSGVHTGDSFQIATTSLLDYLIQSYGTCTLAELGYLHMNYVSYVDNKVDFKICFLAELASPYNADRRGMVINPNFHIFENFMCVGDVRRSCTVETMTVPEYDIIMNENGHEEIVINSDKKHGYAVEVLVFHANIPLTVGALNGLNVMDPNFSVRYQTATVDLGKEEESIVNSGDYDAEMPVYILVRYDPKASGFDPSRSVEYLLKEAEYRDRIDEEIDNVRKDKDGTRKKEKKKFKKNMNALSNKPKEKGGF